LQTIVSRETSPVDAIVISVTRLQAGEAYNIIPDSASLGGTVRALRLDIFEKTRERIVEMAAQVAAVFRCTAELKWTMEPVYPPTVNDGHAWEFAKSVAKGCVWFLLTQAGHI
jgi:metal-dependent amidase/aminoacylase/carboxypeptidase family protein